MVVTPSKGLLEARVIFKNYKVSVSGKELAIDLIFIDLLGFDIILGMDWLENYYVIIDCYSKVITLYSLK